MGLTVDTHEIQKSNTTTVVVESSVKKVKSPTASSTTKRRRGWIDYRLMVYGGERNAFLSTFTGHEVPTRTYVDEDAEEFLSVLDTTQDSNEEDKEAVEKLVQVVTPPSAFGRYPSHRAFDKTTQSADAIVMLLSEGRDWNRLPVRTLFEMLTISLQGQHDMYLNVDPLPERSDKDTPPEPIRSPPRNERRRPIALVINASTSEPENLERRVQQCEEFMTNVGHNIGVRAFGVVDLRDTKKIEEIIHVLCADIEENRGVLFKPPEKLPWDPSTKTLEEYQEQKYPELRLYNKSDENSNSNNSSKLSSWFGSLKNLLFA